MVVRPPTPTLSNWVGAYWSYRAATAGRVARRRIPGGQVTMVIGFEQPVVLNDRSHTCFVVGMRDGPFITEQTGLQHGLQVDLTPLGARALFGVPMRQLTNQVVPLADLLDGQLAQQLAEISTAQDRFDLLDVLIAARLADAPARDPAVAWAYQRIAVSRGRIPVSQLVEETGWSRQHLAQRFRDQVGLTPKVVARVLRFEHAASLLPVRPLADVAAVCGYADQAHLNREFRDLAGCSPRELALTFVQDSAASTTQA